MSTNIVHYRLIEKYSPVVRIWNLFNICYRKEVKICGNTEWFHLTVTRFFSHNHWPACSESCINKKSLLQNSHCDKKCAVHLINYCICSCDQLLWTCVRVCVCMCKCTCACACVCVCPTTVRYSTECAFLVENQLHIFSAGSECVWFLSLWKQKDNSHALWRLFRSKSGMLILKPLKVNFNVCNKNCYICVRCSWMLDTKFSSYSNDRLVKWFY